MLSCLKITFRMVNVNSGGRPLGHLSVQGTSVWAHCAVLLTQCCCYIGALNSSWWAGSPRGNWIHLLSLQGNWDTTFPPSSPWRKMGHSPSSWATGDTWEAHSLQWTLPLMPFLCPMGSSAMEPEQSCGWDQQNLSGAHPGSCSVDTHHWERFPLESFQIPNLQNEITFWLSDSLDNDGRYLTRAWQMFMKS